jgi:hypothetical protein
MSLRTGNGAGPKRAIDLAKFQYPPQPHLRADPFLMAVIPNDQLGAGVGRFVIDFWDEPGFGIASMLK